MKTAKGQYIYIFIGTMTFLFFIACQKDLINDLSRYSLHKELSLINDDYDKSKSVTNKEGILFISEVKLMKEETSFVLLVNDEERSAKRKFKLSFLPTMEESLPFSNIDKAEILYIHRLLVVNPLDRPEVYLFTLFNEDLSPIIDKIKGTDISNIIVFSGYGLTQHKSKLEG